jgi:hypothetical protein
VPVSVEGTKVGGDGGAREASVFDGRRAAIKIDAADHVRMQDRRTQERVVEERHVDAVDEEADVRRRGAANEERGNPGHDGDHARLRLDGAQRIAESAGHAANVARNQGDRSGDAACAADDDLGRFACHRDGSLAG